MHRLIKASGLCVLLLSFVGGLSAAAAVSSCGGKKTPDNPSTKTGDSDEDAGATGDDSKSGDGGAVEAKKDVCVGADISNLEDLLSKSDCEVPNMKPDGLQNPETAGKLEVTATASPTKIAPGGKVDLLVTFRNKTKDAMVLNFRIDPVGRFETEAYEMPKVAPVKGDAGPPPPAPLTKRADIPKTPPPSPPKGFTAPPPADQKVAHVTLAAGGSARVRVPWEAVKMKWAPEKVRGTAVEKGFPRVPAGPLPKGKYTIKVVTPLIGIFEGGEHEVSAPRVDIEVGS